MKKTVELRADVARCLKAARDTADPNVRKKMTARAFHMAQEAEAQDRAAEAMQARSDKKQEPR
jgi:hypothetical protein